MPAFEIDIRNETKKERISMVQLKKVSTKILKSQGFRSGVLSVVLVSDRKIRALNKKYLRHDWATDVIAFGQLETSKKHRSREIQKQLRGTAPVLGDVVISLETAKRQAKEYGHSFFYEGCFYLCPGILHILGWDDHTEHDRKKMWRKQEKILEKVL